MGCDCSHDATDNAEEHDMSRSSINHNTPLLASEEKQQIIQRIKQLSSQTKRSIETACLLAHIIRDFFTNESNKCDISNGSHHDLLNAQSILDKILIAGGAPRDYILHKPINDLDIVCNLRELTKLHILHLRQYHNTLQQQEKSNESQQCIFWRLYMEKYSYKTEEYNDNHSDLRKESIQYLRGCDYLLNAKFIVNHVLQKNNIIASKLHIEKGTKVFKIKIIQKLLYNGCDLNGQEFDILDSFTRTSKYIELFEEKKSDQQTVMKGDRQNPVAFDHISHTKLNSIQMDKFVSHKMANNNKATLDSIQERIDIDLPISEEKSADAIIAFDLAINCLLLKLSFLLNDAPDYQNWNKAIFTPLTASDNHLAQHFANKILSHPHFEMVCLNHGPHIHFWRLMKFAIRLNDWNIHQNAIDITKKYYHLWLTSDTHFLEENAKKNSGYMFFVKSFFECGYAKTVNDYKRMVDIFDELGCNQLIIDALNNEKHKRLKRLWQETMQSIDDGNIFDRDDVILIFETKGYPVFTPLLLSFSRS